MYFASLCALVQDALRIIVVYHLTTLELVPLNYVRDEFHNIVLHQMVAIRNNTRLPYSPLLCCNCYTPQKQGGAPYFYSTQNTQSIVVYCSSPCALAHCGFDPQTLLLYDTLPSSFQPSVQPWPDLRPMIFMFSSPCQHTSPSNSCCDSTALGDHVPIENDSLPFVREITEEQMCALTSSSSEPCLFAPIPASRLSLDSSSSSGSQTYPGCEAPSRYQRCSECEASSSSSHPPSQELASLAATCAQDDGEPTDCFRYSQTELATEAGDHCVVIRLPSMFVSSVFVRDHGQKFAKAFVEEKTSPVSPTCPISPIFPIQGPSLSETPTTLATTPTLAVKSPFGDNNPFHPSRE